MDFRHKTNSGYILQVFWLITSCFCLDFAFAIDTLRANQSIGDSEFLVSNGQSFKLGFFSPVNNSGFRYVGIWYYKVANESVVWVANRERPISGNDGVLTIGNDGNLMVMNGNGEMVWSSNVTVASSNSTAVLMDTGNLVLHGSENLNRVLWQSFDHPTDTYLPDMEVHMNVHDGERRVFTSWKSATDPSPGNYSMGVDPRGSPQIVIWDGLSRRWRSGHWNGLIFTGVEGMRAIYLFGFRLLNERDGGLYFTYTPSNSSDLIKFRINWEGIEVQERWIDGLEEWNVIQSHPVDECDRYNHCGPFGKCNQMDTPRCSCMKGFVAKDTDQWSRGNWSGGCIRRTNLQCEENNSLSAEGRETDGFVQAESVKLPDYVDYVGPEDIRDCERMCLQNCSCTAYAFVSGINCMIWSRDLVDIQQFVEGGSSLFIRLAHSELGKTNQGFTALLLIISPCSYADQQDKNPYLNLQEDSRVKDLELPLFKLDDICAATDEFSLHNKIGQGGFGSVYKGELQNGEKIAVKRLSEDSNQGLQEFKNEMNLIAQLQHRNLVKLLGCCIEGEERMLIYEYMPNKSLDQFIFDQTKDTALNWQTRFDIIVGIARGLLYLHRDSRLRIIHRDLKASNILLDSEMNPKISDFGLARTFGGDHYQENTNRVMGTYGYMAPEYAVDGLFSVKSDVFSFGVLVLEILSGKKNRGFYHPDHDLNLLGHAWKLWNEGNPTDFLDASLLVPNSASEVLRYIQVGLLCVQQRPEDRPTMSNVLLMLDSEDPVLAQPKQPGFYTERTTIDTDSSSTGKKPHTSNEITVTLLQGR
ncbi:hypothetical protein Pfo_013036 [Paulownia fortunei]|nr:hypothetical protein Pfo_013036 [Paulownia fortunei]